MYKFDNMTTEQLNETSKKEFDYEIDYMEDEYTTIKTNPL